MPHRVRAVFRRLVAPCSAAFALALGAATLSAQQTTGKIQGTVTDQAGVAIANAQVLIVGTSFGAATDARGYYFINNVPVGTYTLRFQFIGYAPTEVRNVRVQGGQTNTADAKMQSSAVVISGITVEEARNPIVPRDQVASKTIVSGDLVDRLPVDDVRQVIGLTPGVVESGNDLGVSIRGGRPGEAQIYIDGAPVRGLNTPQQHVQLGTNAVEEASVTTGAIGVEFSDAQSGVISYTTRSGGQKLEGALSYDTDEPFGDGISLGYNRFEGSLGGPVPGVQNLRFFGSAAVQGQVSKFRGWGSEAVPTFVVGGLDQVVTSTDAAGTVTNVALPEYVQFSGTCGNFGSNGSAIATAIQSNYGYECQGRRRPMDWENNISMQGKLQYSYGSGSSVSLTGLANGYQVRNAPGRYIGAPSLYMGRHDWSRVGVLNLYHQVARSAERALSINLNLSYQTDRSMAGALTPESDLESRSPRMGMHFKPLAFTDFAAFPFPITDRLIRNIRSGQGLQVPLLDRTDLNNAQPYRLNPYGLNSNRWYTTGLDVSDTTSSENRFNARLVVDWQANRYHRLTLGGDAKKTDLTYYNGNSTISRIFLSAYTAKPEQFGLFAADRLDLGDVVLELGVRWDYYNSNALFANTPGFISSDPGWNSTAFSDDTAYANSIARVFTPGAKHTTLSPRLRVSFPISEQTNFRLSYSHQVQAPDYSTLLIGTNSDLSYTNTNDIFGRDLDFGKTILFEFGVRHAFSSDLVLDASAYNKDKVSDFAARTLPFVSPRDNTDTTSINVLTNRDFGNSRGVDFKLDWRVGTNLSTTVAYTLQVSKSTGSDPQSYLNTFARQTSGLSGDRTPPPEAAQLTNDDRTHNIAATIALTFPSDWRKGTAAGNILSDLGLFTTIRVQSGLAFTKLRNDGNGQLVPFLDYGLTGQQDDDHLNASTLPWTRYIDMRLNKGIRIGRTDLTAFADIRNVFNFKNIIGAFAETGDVVNQKYKENIIGNPDRETGEYGFLWAEARDATALLPGNAVDLGSCGGWGKPVNCESLRRTEARFGDGNGIFTQPEQERTFNAYYDAQWARGTLLTPFYGQERHIRVGFEVTF